MSKRDKSGVRYQRRWDDRQPQPARADAPSLRSPTPCPTCGFDGAAVVHRCESGMVRWPVRAEARTDTLRDALARAIKGGYAEDSIDPDLYHNDPVYHAVVYEVRQARGDAATDEAEKEWVKPLPKPDWHLDLDR